MSNSARACSVLICLIFAMATPALAQQLISNPVISDYMANTAMGSGALANVLPAEAGCHNTASGDEALYSDTIGSYNTATGFSSLWSNTTGSNNTAAGYESLYFNSTGSNNTASGYQALYTNTIGGNNTASGYQALMANTTGSNNTAFGNQALNYNTTGLGNAAQGANALYSNTIGVRNLGIGNNALYANSTGSYNIALGFDAGYNVVNGSYNIEIGAKGTASDNNTIQIGVQGTQNTTRIAGISGTTLTGSAVYVTPTGQLGVLASSERFKTDVEAMGAASEKLAQLRPVTFKLKTDSNRTMQYGLIAEEVAKVYPELVIRGADGRIDGVRYEELAPMLLNMVQQQQAKLAAQEERYASLAGQIQEMQRQLAEVQQPKN